MATIIKKVSAEITTQLGITKLQHAQHVLHWHPCTKNKKGRLIERSEYQQYIEKNKQNIDANPEIYKLRQSIVEHPYGTIKRQWGFYYVITKKGMKRASADVGFMFIAYNLRRMMNILDIDMFKKFLRELSLLFFAKAPLIKPKQAFLRASYSLRSRMNIIYMVA